MKMQQRIHRRAGVEETHVVRANHPPNTESCMMEGGIGPEVGDEKGYRNRTTIVKRRQGTMRAVRSHRTLLKRYSLVRHINASGESVAKPKPNTDTTAKGEDVEDLPGSESMARIERKVRNLGRPLCLLVRNTPKQGRAEQRKKADRRVVKRGVRSSHGRAGQEVYLPSKPPDASRRGRQNNAARKRTMPR